jgi:hypothetical protein
MHAYMYVCMYIHACMAAEPPPCQDSDANQVDLLVGGHGLGNGISAVKHV